MTTERKYFLFRVTPAGDEIYCSGITKTGLAASTSITGRRAPTNHPRKPRPALQFSTARNAYDFAAMHDVLKYWRVGKRYVVDEIFDDPETFAELIGAPVVDESEFDQVLEA